MNQVQLIGRLTKDPELRMTPNGLSVCRFTLAVNRMKKDEADFISCIAFDKLAQNLVDYQKKGNRIAITGRIQTGSYENQQGQRIYTTEVVANSIEFLDYRSENVQNSPNSAQNYQGNTNYQSSNQNASTAQNQPNNDPFSGYSSLPDDIDDNLPF
ncbi:single-stranded DNA-binding protein [Ureibacillus thermosphaericus]|uniref:Single-stranded DNA-binding protein n=1 Tax=Ureibacillus thermosphaericus TaxID=51173 RepID=A0A840PVJ6_URETH|nr:single-stranded DNA-binding protein [Ureibacillus thermosphaericus]MBB5148198.1 single-strand DNA-binding protein [Ureibacillus thermosphaericus]NKZ31108.1 single-stranded DNA-binding protein [Ureibacillus thermosphaericus]